MDLKREYKNYDKKLVNNNNRINELLYLKQKIENEILKLESENISLTERKLEVGLIICQNDGHIGDWYNSYIEEGNVICTCSRCKSKARIKL